MHVGLDALNGYGVQCLRPFSKKWVHLDVLTIWDPFLFGLHAAALAGWAAGAVEPVPAFPLLYAATLLYLAVRWRRHRRWLRRVRSAFRPTGACYVSPCLHWSRRTLLVEEDDRFLAGFIRRGRFEDIGTIAKNIKADGHPWVEASKSSEAVDAFLGFAARAHVDVNETENGWIVRWRDARFHFGPTKLPFGVDVRLDRSGAVVSESIGWRKRAWEGPYV